MCVLLRESALPLLTGLRRAKNFDTSIPLPNLWLLKRLLFLAFLKNRTEAEIPPNFGFWKSRFFHWGARLSFFSWFDRVFSFILLNVNLWCLKNLATTNFLALCIFIESPPLSFCESMYLKTGQILGVGFSQNLFKFCICLGFCFRFCFIRKVHREAFPKSTYKYCRIFESLTT